ncbi:MAG: glycosyltransferase family 2 protein [Kouleothrix sp.]|nr:glycosyltransferase family 2 protein [Kouleothrix sp.]
MTKLMSDKLVSDVVLGTQARNGLPLVTVIMPIRNEARYIERSLGSVLSQDYPAGRIEVLVVDGMSDDDTRRMVQRIVEERRRRGGAEAARVAVIDNPARTAPAALNIGLQQARGDVIIRVDGHCEIPPEYVRLCIDALDRTGADCAGGALVTLGETQLARAIAAAQSSRFGVGGVAFRTGRAQGEYVDTVAFGAYHREVFERIGGFDEELVRNQDDELNFRLTQSGGKIWLDPAISSVYYSRASLGKLWRQYFEYGFYKVRVIQKRGAVASWRHLAPGAFVLSLLASLLLALLTRQPRWALIVIGPYAIANGAASLATSRNDLRALPLMPLVFGTLHVAYGAGFLWGIYKWNSR